MDIRLPNGTIIRNIPDGTPKDVIMQKAIAKGIAKPEDFQLEQPQKPEGFGARLDRELKDIPRQLGLTARYAIEGPAEVAGIFTDPIAYALNKFGLETPKLSDTASGLATSMGLPKPEGAMENVVGTASKMMAGVAPLTGGAMLAKPLGRAAQGIATGLSANPAGQVVGAGAGGGAGEYAKQTGGGTGAQVVASLGGALVGSGLVSIAGKINQAIRGNVKDINAMVGSILSKQGIKLKDIPKANREALIKEIRAAKDSGQELDDQAIRRLGEYLKLGATPTRGSVTLDPVALTKERNLQKLSAQSDNPAIADFARIPRQNERVLLNHLDEMGALKAPGSMETGKRLQQSLVQTDIPEKQAIDAAYQGVRDASGRYANLNTKQFSELANNALDEGQLGAVLPNEARTILNNISSGKVPFNVNTAQQVDETLSGLQRDSGMRTKAALAIGKIRDAIKNTDIESTEGIEAMDQYRAAQSMARSRFKKIEGLPALKNALDSEDPDKFVSKYILGGSSSREVNNLAKNIDPEAKQLARDHILYYLKDKALSGKPDEIGNFSYAAFNREIEKLKDKLPEFFTDEEISLLNTIRNVAGYEKYQPSGSAINNSNTAAAFAGILERLAGNTKIGRLISYFPGGSLVQEPIRNYVNQRAINQATGNYLTAGKTSRKLPPPQLIIPTANVLSKATAQ